MIGALIPIFHGFLTRRARFHISFFLSKKLRIDLYDRPGQFLSDTDLQKLVEDLRAVAARGQEGKEVPLYGALLGERADLSKRILTIAYDAETDEPVGFNALAYLDVPVGVTQITVVHLGLIFVDPEWQKRHLPSILYGLTTFLLFFQSGFRAFWISNVTQVPAIAGMTAMNYHAVYPTHLEDGRQTFTHLVLARGIMKYHRSAFGVGDDAGFDEAQQVITNAYTGGSDHLKKTFASAPKHRDARCNTMMEKMLDYDRGDDVLQLGVCNIPAILRYISSQAGHGFAKTLIFQALNLVVLGMLVPIVRWLVPDFVSVQNRSGFLDTPVDPTSPRSIKP